MRASEEEYRSEEERPSGRARYAYYLTDVVDHDWAREERAHIADVKEGVGGRAGVRGVIEGVGVFDVALCCHEGIAVGPGGLETCSRLSQHKQSIPCHNTMQ
jgi:hypothetical protein